MYDSVWIIFSFIPSILTEVNIYHVKYVIMRGQRERDENSDHIQEVYSLQLWVLCLPIIYYLISKIWGLEW